MKPIPSMLEDPAEQRRQWLKRQLELMDLAYRGGEEFIAKQHPAFAPTAAASGTSNATKWGGLSHGYFLLCVPPRLRLRRLSAAVVCVFLLLCLDVQLSEWTLIMTDETNQLPAEVKLTPIMQMMETAVARGDIEVVTKLMDLQERAEANQARREFDAAFAAVKAKVGIIRKTGKANYGLYADLADIARALDPAIAEHGLSYRFRSARVGNELIMTCVVCHRSGHYEENSLPSPLDTSGSKNPVQAVGSTSTYLQRYTLMQAFGLATSVNGGEIHDDDGAGADVHQPGDYVGNGTRAKDTEPKGPQTFSRRDIAEITKITSVTALHDWGAAHSSQVNGYPSDIRDKVYKAFRARLSRTGSDRRSGRHR